RMLRFCQLAARPPAGVLAGPAPRRCWDNPAVRCCLSDDDRTSQLRSMNQAGSPNHRVHLRTMALLFLPALPVARRRQRDVAKLKGHAQRVRLGQLQTALRAAHPVPALEFSECGHVHADECLLPGVILQIAQHTPVETGAALVWVLDGLLKPN